MSTLSLRITGNGDAEGIIVRPKSVFAAAAMVLADEAVMFRDGWGYLRIRAVPHAV
jgi:hypothetical protein